MKKKNDIYNEGIDLSYAQGKVDFVKVKEDGIGFAFIRIGYGRELYQKDAEFENNYHGARAAGILIGGYHYSYATTVDRAKQEAKACLQMIGNKKFDLPIAYDLEEPEQYKLMPDELYAIYNAFAEEIIAAGHSCMLYTNLNWMVNKWSKTKIVEDEVKIWMAQYNATMDYKDKNAVHIWQYSSKGMVPGITGMVDKNVCLLPLEELLQSQKAEWREQNGKYCYRHADGSFAQNGWEQIDGKWYYFDSDGWIQTGWIKDKEKWYYLKESGEMASEEVLTIYDDAFGKEVYAFAIDGHMLTQRNSRGALI